MIALESGFWRPVDKEGGSQNGILLVQFGELKQFHSNGILLLSSLNQSTTNLYITKNFAFHRRHSYFFSQFFYPNLH